MKKLNERNGIIAKVVLYPMAMFATLILGYAGSAIISNYNVAIGIALLLATVVALFKMGFSFYWNVFQLRYGFYQR